MIEDIPQKPANFLFITPSEATSTIFKQALEPFPTDIIYTASSLSSLRELTDLMIQIPPDYLLFFEQFREKSRGHTTILSGVDFLLTPVGDKLLWEIPKHRTMLVGDPLNTSIIDFYRDVFFVDDILHSRSTVLEIRTFIERITRQK